jgi:hypothetical protein
MLLSESLKRRGQLEISNLELASEFPFIEQGLRASRIKLVYLKYVRLLLLVLFYNYRV